MPPFPARESAARAPHTGCQIKAFFLLAFAALLWLPLPSAELSAQRLPVHCTEEPCPTYEPEITIAPLGGNWTASTATYPVSVTIYWCNTMGAGLILLNGSSVGGFTHTVHPPTLACNSNVASQGTVHLPSGTHLLRAQGTSGLGVQVAATATYTYTQVIRGVSVLPDAHPVSGWPNSASSYSFTVSNVGNTAATYQLAPTCSGAVSGCTAAGSIPLAPGASAAVPVNYVSGAPGGTGTLRLTATDMAAPGIQDAGTVSISLAGGSPQAPVVSTALLNPGTTLERGLCLTIPVANAGAYECGDLRITHALPTARTLNKTRTPVLLYNSQHAAVHPAVVASVTLPAGGASPTSVTARLYVRGALRKTTSFPAGDWTPGDTRLITLAYADPGLGTGVHPYRIEVDFVYPGTQISGSSSGDLVVVNRLETMFGSGWWLAGWERLHFSQSDTTARLWVGGDGSTRLYRKARHGVWGAENVDRPDTLRLDGTPYGYVRELGGGLRVYFDNAGRHTQTVNRLGHVTRFFSRSVPPYGERLDSIQSPSPGGAITTHRLGYTMVSTAYGSRYRVSHVTSYPARAGDVVRVTELVSATSDFRISRIVDPDGRHVDFSFDPAFPARIMGRSDRRGTLTRFEYDGGGRLSRAAVVMGGNAPEVRLDWTSQLTRGLTRSIAPAQAYTKYDAPRTDLGDTTAFYLNRWGAPDSIRNALGGRTRILAVDPTYPWLATHMETTGGLRTSAVYDARGNVLSVTRHSPLDDGRNAVTQYRYRDPRWPDFVTTVVSPMGDSVVNAYDAAGNRIHEYGLRGYGSRIEYLYDGLGRVTSTRTPGQRAVAGAPRDSIEYDAQYGNLFRTRSPLGFWRTAHKDALGRDTLVVSPIDSAQTQHRRTRMEYDLMDREIRVTTIGPSMAVRNIALAVVATGSDTAIVQTFYNAVGTQDSVVRMARPDRTSSGRIATRYRYDAMGRVVAEIAADGMRDSTEYDPAGHVTAMNTRRGHRITYQYDALGRLRRRELPSVSDGPSSDAGSTNWAFPLYAVDPDASGRTIPGDVYTYDYDSSGRLSQANNRHALISRTYYPNGLLRSDTLAIRSYTGVDYTTHRYGLTYSYDLNGRRLSVAHPQVLAAPLAGTDRPSPDGIRTRYVYNDTTGLLQAVVDPLGNQFTFAHDDDQLLARLTFPGGITETRGYDPDGRLRTRVRLAPAAIVQHPDQGGYYGSNTVANDRLSYNAAGQIVAVTTQLDTSRFEHTGLGAIAFGTTQRVMVGREGAPFRETGTLDALGNKTLGVRRTYEPWIDPDSIPPGNWWVNQVPALDSVRYVYQPGTGRLVGSSTRRIQGTGGWPELEQSSAVYDAGGNLVMERRSTLLQPIGLTSIMALESRTASYYDAEGRLRALDRRTMHCSSRNPPTGCTSGLLPFVQYRGVFQEYRYDALGRRILVRSRSDVTCQGAYPQAPDCDQSIRRTVWDGEQILYEIRYPGGNLATAAQMAQDTGFVAPPDTSYYAPYGRVLYVHGAELDMPLEIIRFSFSNAFRKPLVIVPHSNWRGTPDGHSFADGSFQQCRSPANSWKDCVIIDWTGDRIGTSLEAVRADWAEPRGWMGSLGHHQRDASGLLYRRNRYYDPVTGRFTQEDPIGLAGGMNLYGYGNGDPVTYSDPYGLSPWSDDCPGCTLNFGDGYGGRLDQWADGRYEIHVYRGSEEIGVFGKDGWINKHRAGGRIPEVPRDVLNQINSANVEQMRRRGLIAPQGRQNIRGGRYSDAVRRLFNSRILGAVGGILNVGATWQADQHARELGISPFTYMRLQMLGATPEEIEAMVGRNRAE